MDELWNAIHVGIVFIITTDLKDIAAMTAVIDESPTIAYPVPQNNVKVI